MSLPGDKALGYKSTIIIESAFVLPETNRLDSTWLDSPSVGVVHVVLVVQPDRLGVELYRLLVLLGGEVLVAKPGDERYRNTTNKD